MTSTGISQYAAAINQISSLSKGEQARLFSYLKRQLHGFASINQDAVNQQIREARFSSGFCCPTVIRPG